MTGPMRALAGLNDLLRFALELAIFVVFFAFGYSLGGNLLTSLVGGVVLVLLFGALWGSFAAPKRRVETPAWVPGAMFLAYGLLAVLMLLSFDKVGQAVLLAVLVVANEGTRLAGLQLVSRSEPRR